MSVIVDSLEYVEEQLKSSILIDELLKIMEENRRGGNFEIRRRNTWVELLCNKKSVLVIAPSEDNISMMNISREKIGKKLIMTTKIPFSIYFFNFLPEIIFKLIKWWEHDLMFIKKLDVIEKTLREELGL